jgi:hypothetical protein
MKLCAFILQLPLAVLLASWCPLAAQETSGPSLLELAALVPPVPPPKQPVPSLATLIGDCASGQPHVANGATDSKGVRPVGDLTTYRALIQIISAPNAFVRARASAGWPSQDRRNVLGFLRAGSYVWAEGPLKDGDPSAGVGWAVPVHDLSGKDCRAYLSNTVVRVLFNGPMTQSQFDRIVAEQAATSANPSTVERK